MLHSYHMQDCRDKLHNVELDPRCMYTIIKIAFLYNWFSNLYPRTFLIWDDQFQARLAAIFPD